MRKILPLIILCALFLSGCAGNKKVFLTTKVPVNTFLEKVPGSFALVFSPGIRQYVNRISTTGDFCAGKHWDIYLGTGIRTAVRQNLAAIMPTIVERDSLPTPGVVLPQNREFAGFIYVEIAEISDSFEVAALTIGHHARANFALALRTTILDANGEQVLQFDIRKTGNNSAKVIACNEVSALVASTQSEVVEQIAAQITTRISSAPQVRQVWGF